MALFPRLPADETMINPYWTQAILPGDQQMPQPMPSPFPEQKKGGGIGNFLKTLLGSGLDGVARYYEAEPGFANAQKTRMEHQALLQQSMAKRQADWQDWKARQDYERANTPPDQPAIVKNLHAFQNFTPEERKAFGEYQALVNPRYMTGKDGLPYQSNAPQFDPTEWEPFDPAGGPTQPASGGFRR